MKNFFKGLFLLVGLSVSSKAVVAQLDNPVKWKFSTRKVSEGTFEVRAKATIEHPWHIYSKDANEDLGLPTTITLNKNPLVEIEGETKEIGNPEEITIEGVELKYYPGTVEFVQLVKLKKGVRAKVSISGKVDFMACTDIQCLPPASRRFNVVLAE